MNEENNQINEPSNDTFQDDWKAPPIPEKIPVEEKEQAEMSEVSTLVNIFFEPGRVFEDLRKKPRFLLGFILVAILSSAFIFAFQYKVGEDRMRRFLVTQNEQSPQYTNAPPEQQEQMINIGLTIQKVITYLFPLFIAIVFFIGGLLYWLGVKAMGGTANLFHGISVFVYSAIPPAVIGNIANFLILFLKSSDDIDIASSSRGLVKANPTALFDGKDMPVLTTIISTFDVFVIWGLILAVIGLHKTGKISKGSAFAIVIIITLIGITFRVIQAFFGGTPA